MSLSTHRDAIEAAVAGELEDERPLRAHLAGCGECRAHYDVLVLSLRATKGTNEPTNDELARERARLEAAMAPPAVRQPAPRRWAFFWIPAAVAAALVLFVIRPFSGPDVTERGGVEVPAAPFTISLYAKAKSGSTPVRLAAEFPTSGEATVSENEWLQVSSKNGAVVVAVSEAGVQSFGAGESVSLAQGKWRVFAVTGATLEEVVSAAKSVPAGEKRLPLAKPQVTGVVSVQP